MLGGVRPSTGGRRELYSSNGAGIRKPRPPPPSRTGGSECCMQSCQLCSCPTLPYSHQQSICSYPEPDQSSPIPSLPRASNLHCSDTSRQYETLCMSSVYSFIVVKLFCNTLYFLVLLVVSYHLAFPPISVILSTPHSCYMPRPPHPP
jgi:hypothetical protein